MKISNFLLIWKNISKKGGCQYLISSDLIKIFFYKKIGFNKKIKISFFENFTLVQIIVFNSLYMPRLSKNRSI